MSDKKIEQQFIKICGYRKGGDNKYPVGGCVIFQIKHLIGWKYLDDITIEVVRFEEDGDHYSGFDVRSSEFDNGTHSSYEGLWITPDAYATFQGLLLTMPSRILSIGEAFVE